MREMHSAKKPKITALENGELLRITRAQILLAISIPFFCAFAYFIFTASGNYFIAAGLLVGLSYFSYPSTSHDLAHRAYRLPKKLNDTLLSIIELLCLRSGTAYRVVHMKHHQCFPAHEDVEGKAAHLTFVQALLYGILFQPKVWLYVFHQKPSARKNLLIELTSIFSIWIIALNFINTIPQLLIYCIVMHISSWTIPVMTSYFPHKAEGSTEHEQTKRFRGTLFSILALEHLYHLEHHMYPMVPHQNWAKLAKRLDPYLDSKGVKAIKLIK